MAEECERSWRMTGRVQGVGFRASCRQEALRLHLRGLAMNCPDGSVEVLARGPEAALLALELWLGQGPRWARVDEVVRLPNGTRECPAQGFLIG